MLVAFGWPGWDTVINRMVCRLLRPLWVLGVRPRILARMLVLVATAGVVGLLIAGSVSRGLLVGLVFSLAALAWAFIAASVVFHAIPIWDRANEEMLDSVVVTLETITSLRHISIIRTACFGGCVGAVIGESALVLTGLSPFLMLWPACIFLLLLSLHATTVLGHPPRSLQRRAVDKAKQAFASRPKLVPMGI